MLNLNTKTAELIISGDQHTSSAIRLISPILLNTDPLGKTQFFGIVQSPNAKLLKIIEEIIDFAKNKTMAQEDEETTTQKFVNFPTPRLAVESQLETLLQNINSKLENVLSKKELQSTIFNTNIILGLQNDDALSLAGRGEIQAVIIRPKNNFNEFEDNDSYEVLNLLKQTMEEIDLLPDEQEELFSHFISGKISNNDTLTISTKNLWDKMIEENILRGVAILPPNSAIEFIKNNLSKWRGGGAVAFLLKYNPSEIIKPRIARRQRFGRAFQNSIEELMGTEQKTEKILSAPTPFKKSLFSFFEIFNPNKQNKINKKYHRQNKTIQRNLRGLFDKLFFVLKFLSSFLLKFFHRLFLITIDKNKRHNIIKEIKTDFNKGRGGFISWFNSLPKKSRILFVIAIFLIFVFTQSIFIFSIKQGYKNKNERYNKLIQEIKNVAEEAEASLIYGDDKKAEKLLEDANILLINIDKKTKKAKEQAGFLQELINKKWTKLYHIIDVSEPRLLADLGNTAGKFLIESNSSIYILSPENALILKMNPDSGQINPHLIFEDMNQAPSFWTQKDAQNIILFKENQNQITSAKELVLNNKNTKPINCSQITEKIKDLKIFNDKLYILDAEQGKIWKHSQNLSGFTQGKNWLKEDNINLKNTIALTLDGSIYVLKSNGELLKLYAGKNTDFKAKAPKPINREGEYSIDNAKIWTSSETKFIYILDKTNNRIIVFDKNGKLAAQYISSSFTDLKDFTIIEKEHKIYILNGAQIYGVIATHIDFKQNGE